MFLQAETEFSLILLIQKKGAKFLYVIRVCSTMARTCVRQRRSTQPGAAQELHIQSIWGIFLIPSASRTPPGPWQLSGRWLRGLGLSVAVFLVFVYASFWGAQERRFAVFLLSLLFPGGPEALNPSFLVVFASFWKPRSLDMQFSLYGFASFWGPRGRVSSLTRICRGPGADLVVIRRDLAAGAFGIFECLK